MSGLTRLPAFGSFTSKIEYLQYHSSQQQSLLIVRSHRAHTRRPASPPRTAPTLPSLPDWLTFMRFCDLETLRAQMYACCLYGLTLPPDRNIISRTCLSIVITIHIFVQMM
ncbi:hypothetical protein EVAR_83440_1 [Eumeta japonica]|uniref:Uncharacterized protein n=1 Tax=Eumeta variegata TaxID=151549 RepID=A0A4C1TYN4_EUMVA|nr:hypothetical protein EVAR_83440_1 [Eumeta japonica]